MNISAVDKKTGKDNKITITNNKGRLSKEEIEKLVKEAAAREKEDTMVRERVEAKNSYEGLVYNIRNKLKEEEIKSKLSPEEVTKVD
jgi:L1 cell adhesion molecule like protein